jgi:hypothetical protein
MTVEDKFIGRRVRLLGDHRFAGNSAEVVGFDQRIGLRVKLLRGDAMDGHECYVTRPEQFRAEKKGLDW